MCIETISELSISRKSASISAANRSIIQRGLRDFLTTSSVAIFIPFTTQELFQTGKEALYCGVNALSNNLIMVDRKLLKNPNGLILGTPGSGKSFSAKREITNVFLVTEDDIIICDPEAEYGPLVERLHGQVIKISPTSTDFINPMDLNLNYSEEENPLSLKSDFILSLCELIVGGKEGLQPVEKTIIDRCVRLIYRDYLNDPKPENMPILEDLYNELRKQDEKEAQYLATALEIYVTGSLNVFNHRTNVNIESRVVSYDIKELGKQLKKIGNSTYSGCPQGGILSPILANIYLNELDRFIEKLKLSFDKRTPYKTTPEYTKIQNQRVSLSKKINRRTDGIERDMLIEEYKKLTKKMYNTPAKLCDDKKIKYVRYADDFLIAVNGSKKDCEWIKSQLTNFIRQELKMELSQEKTLITHSNNYARFLGYDIRVRRDQQLKPWKNVKQRTLGTNNDCEKTQNNGCMSRMSQENP